MKVKEYIVAALLGFVISVRSATVSIPVAEDTSLFEADPTFNLGASNLAAGSINEILTATGAPGRSRALLRFDLSSIADGANVTAAQLTVTVVRSPGSLNPPASTFELHRMLKRWGEGVQGGVVGGPATDGEATWLAPMHPGPEWSGPGASGADDSSAVVSSSIEISQPADYTFPSTPFLVADVQNWLTNSASNFGWLMRSAAENVRQTARRFGNRESGSGVATLTVTYELPATELRIQQFELRADGMFLSWTGGTPPFQVERAAAVTGPWTAVTTASNETQATVPKDGDIAFYRVVSTTP